MFRFASRRRFGISASLRNARASLTEPAPLRPIDAAVSESAELKALREKAKGAWKNLTKEEKITRKSMQIDYRQRSYGRFRSLPRLVSSNVRRNESADGRMEESFRRRDAGSGCRHSFFLPPATNR